MDVGVQLASAKVSQEDIDRIANLLRAEYTVMPRFGYHQPMDYLLDSFPPRFQPVIHVEGHSLPLPAPPDRFGYPADDAEYLRMGEMDANIFKKQISKHLGDVENLSILDFGCSVGRVLRHFDKERVEKRWKLNGIDVQALCIEWLRLHFPEDYCVTTGTVMPHLPFEDNSLDIIYGISVFTHIKYLWDMWVLELRRVLKPGGLLLQTIHTENAWTFYHKHKHLDWVRAGHSAVMLESEEMTSDWFHYGDIAVSQAFWKAETAKRYWGRYLEVVDLLPPQHEFSFQDVMVCRKR